MLVSPYIAFGNGSWRIAAGKNEMLLAILLFAGTVWPMPPSGAIPSGCTIQDSIVEHQSKVWLVYGYFKLPDGSEKHYLFAHREANERKKALLDCDDFMKHYEKRNEREKKR